MRMIAYVRVSSVGGRDVESERYQTEQIQLEEIQRWGRERDIEVVSGPEYVDRDVSGAKDARPGFEAAMKALTERRADGIVVATLDRFSRQSTIDALKRVQEVQDAGGTIASVGGEVPVDPTTPAGEFQLTIFAAIARMQWREYDRRWKTAKRRAAERGVQIARAPLGYVRGSDGRLMPGPLAPLVTRAYELAAAEDVHAALAHLREHDTEAPDGRWNMQNLRRTLARRVYLGELDWNGSVSLRDNHEPLTDLATWTRAQSDPRWGRAPSSSYPLSGGPAFCGSCGTDLVGGLNKGGGERAYRCATSGGRRTEVECAARVWIYADALEQYALELLVLEAEAREMDPEMHPEIVPEHPVGSSSGVAEAERSLEEARLRREEYAAAGLDVSPEVWAVRARALDEAVDQAELMYLTALREASPQLVPTSVDIRDGGVEGLSGFLARLSLRVRVEPGRASVAERAHLVALSAGDTALSAGEASNAVTQVEPEVPDQRS